MGLSIDNKPNMNRATFCLLLLCIVLPGSCCCQFIQKISFDDADSTNGYYLAVPPASSASKGALVLMTSFLSPEQLLRETKLHNIASANEILTVIVSMKQKLYADSASINRLNLVLNHVTKKYAAATSSFVLAGYGEAGTIALRFTEFTVQHPEKYHVRPKAVIGIDTPVDLVELWHWSERQIKKNYWPGAVGDAHFYLDAMKKEIGNLTDHLAAYQFLTPFYNNQEAEGNEKYLANIPVRLYYDTDIEWQLENRGNSLYDTKIPDATALVNRLRLMGNKEAELKASKFPGVWSDGTRHPSAPSIVDEVECIQWIRKTLHIFDPRRWVAPYELKSPDGWPIERFTLPADFAPGMTFNGIEDLRFTPGWGDISSAEYWSYAYLWWLDKDQQPDLNRLIENLQAYYLGLVNRNIISRKIPADKIVPTKVQLKKTKTAAGDRETYTGKVTMLDYMQIRPLSLNIAVHLKRCAQGEQLPVLVEVSPQPYLHAVWKKFYTIEQSFICGK